MLDSALVVVVLQHRVHQPHPDYQHGYQRNQHDGYHNLRPAVVFGQQVGADCQEAAEHVEHVDRGLLIVADGDYPVVDVCGIGGGHRLAGA